MQLYLLNKETLEDLIKKSSVMVDEENILQMLALIRGEIARAEVLHDKKSGDYWQALFDCLNESINPKEETPMEIKDCVFDAVPGFNNAEVVGEISPTLTEEEAFGPQVMGEKSPGCTGCGKQILSDYDTKYIGDTPYCRKCFPQAVRDASRDRVAVKASEGNSHD